MEVKKIIVSITSYPARIATDTVHLVVESILAGTVKPSLVVLYLWDREFPDGLPTLPPKLTALLGPRFEIRFTQTGHRGYKKLAPALRDFPDATIITIDDDQIYPPQTLEKILAVHKKYPSAIVSARSRYYFANRPEHVRPFLEKRKIRDVALWIKSRLSGRDAFAPRINNSIIGYCGVLYPPNALDPIVFDTELYEKLTPMADDIWFWAMAAKKGTPIAWVPFDTRPREIRVAQATSLKSVNVYRRKNDEQLAAVLDYFPDIKAKLPRV